MSNLGVPQRDAKQVQGVERGSAPASAADAARGAGLGAQPDTSRSPRVCHMPNPDRHSVRPARWEWPRPLEPVAVADRQSERCCDPEAGALRAAMESARLRLWSAPPTPHSHAQSSGSQAETDSGPAKSHARPRCARPAASSPELVSRCPLPGRRLLPGSLARRVGGERSSVVHACRQPVVHPCPKEREIGRAGRDQRAPSIGDRDARTAREVVSRRGEEQRGQETGHEHGGGGRQEPAWPVTPGPKPAPGDHRASDHNQADDQRGRSSPSGDVPPGAVAEQPFSHHPQQNDREQRDDQSDEEADTAEGLTRRRPVPFTGGCSHARVFGSGAGRLKAKGG
ncbi:MAG: hypothetical protein QOI76_4050 [Frankiales bacterium]|nr:hypothetical protein [Frankiales bacterium]